MSSKRKKLAKKELEKIYDNRFKWLQAGRFLHGRFNNSFEDNPCLKLILKLSLFANVGIWLTVYLVTLKIV